MSTTLAPISPEQMQKLAAIAKATEAEALRQGVSGVALVVVLDDNGVESNLGGAVVAATAVGLNALAVNGAEHLRGTMQRAVRADAASTARA